MERKVTKLENCHVEVLVTVTEEAWKEAQKKAFEKLAKNVTVPGFRKGKAPTNLVKDKVNQVQVMDEAINGILPSLYREVLEEEHLQPYAQPKVDVTKLSDTELEVKFIIVTAPEVVLGAYTGLEIGKETVEVTEEEVTNALLDVQKQNASLVIKEGASELGDTVVIDFVGTIDGVEFDGGKAENYELELGSHSFVPGFEEQLVGKVAGDEVDVNVTFPENYHEHLKGKAAVFACKVHEVKAKSLPELDDELIKELKIPGVETVEAFREHKANELKAQKERNARNTYFGKLLDKIAEISTISIPEEIINNQVESSKKDITNRMAQSGLTLEQYLSIVGQTEEDFLNKLREDAYRDARNYFILSEVANKEDLKVTDEELEFEYAKIADQYKMSIEDVKKALGAQSEEFRHNVKMQRTEDFLYANNN